MNTESAKDVLQLAASRAEDVVAVAADKAQEHLLAHAEDRLEATAERAASKALDGLFLRIGMDTSDAKAVLAMQKDFAHLRAWRESTDLIRKRGLATLVTVAVTGLLGILYAALTHRL